MTKLEQLLYDLCPDGVEYRDIGDIAEVGTGSSNGNEAIDDGAYPFFVRSQTIKAKDDYEYDEEAIIIPGEGGIGEIFHYANGKYALHQRVYRIHFLTEDINVKFAYYYMQANFKSFILKKAVSATVTSIRKPMVEGFPMPILPLPVQDEIVRILDNLKERTEELTAELSAELVARKQQYNYYRNQLLTREKSTEFIPLSELAKFTYGYTDSAKDEGDTRFIRITDITEDGCLNSINDKYITLTADCKRYLLHKGDLLLARTGATYGKTLYYPTDKQAVYASFLIKIALDNARILNRYYWHFSKSSLYWKQAEKLVSKGGQQQFNTNAVCRVVVPVPSLTAQEEIVRILDNFDAIYTDLNIDLLAEIEARQKQYEYYRDKLLTFKELR